MSVARLQSGGDVWGLSIVVPAFNEREVLPEFHRRLAAVLDTLRVQAEILYINDGSSDDTIRIMHGLRAADSRVAVLDLSRNFGKEIAVTAGLDHTNGDAVIVIDVDLQDPPELIPTLIQAWREGHDVVYAQRIEREGETHLKKLTAFIFYRLMHKISRVKVPTDAGDYRLLSRRAVESLRRLRERHRFMKGLFAWIGYPQKAIPYRRDPRFAGATKFNYWKLWNFALEGFTSFTIGPLKVATYLGSLIALWTFGFAGWIIIKTLVFGEPARGYPTLMVVILFLGGVQLISIGVLGEYVGRMFNETKSRPLYLLNEYAPADLLQPTGASIDAAGLPLIDTTPVTNRQASRVDRRYPISS